MKKLAGHEQGDGDKTDKNNKLTLVMLLCTCVLQQLVVNQNSVAQPPPSVTQLLIE